MTAIYKREFKSCLQGMIGCLVIAFLLAFVGIYFSYYNLMAGYTEMTYALSYSSFIYYLIIPILTMRVFSEERKQKTDQMLLTAPITVGKIVVGKYFAMISILFIPIAIIGLYPIVLSFYGEVSFGLAYAALFGYLLYGAAGISLGLFISSITESQVLAAVGTLALLISSNMIPSIQSMLSESSAFSFTVFLVLWLAASYVIYCMNQNVIISGVIALAGVAVLIVLYVIKTEMFAGGLQTVIGIFSLQERMTNLLNNIFDWTAVVYYLSVISVFLFLTVQSIQKRRWS